MPSTVFQHLFLEKAPHEYCESFTDDYWLALALEEALKGIGRTHPNPPVGAVVVQNDHLIAKGYHAFAGSSHAEVVALSQAGNCARGATLYVTLEPCNHFGRTPPCTQAIVEAGISKVVYLLEDRNPLVKGGGAKFLEKEGVSVVRAGADFLKELAQAIIVPYEHRFTHNRPYVILKAALSQDEKVTHLKGARTSITGPESKKMAHQLRDCCDAILVGSQTVKIDDPLLTVRESFVRDDRQPISVVLDTHLQTLDKAKVYHNPRCLVFHSVENTPSLRTKAELIKVPLKGANLEIEAILNVLFQKGINSLLVEGGPQVWASFRAARCVDELWCWIAPEIVGGQGLDAGFSLKKNKQPYLLGKDELHIFRY